MGPFSCQEGEYGSFDSCTFRSVKLLQWAGRLEGEANIFCLFEAAHLEAMRTRKNLAQRRAAKERVLRNLLGRQLDPFEGRAWYRLIDWIMRLPEAVDLELYAQLHPAQEEKMTYISTAERVGLQKGRDQGLHEGLHKGIAVALKLKFGQAGADLMPRVHAISDTTKLEAFLDAIESRTLEQLTALLPAVNGAAP